MMIQIDTETGVITVDEGGKQSTTSLSSPEGFKLLSDVWLRSGWDLKHVYSFTWMGRPLIQLPEDMIRLAEVIHAVQPDVIIETGVAHGGGLVYYASLCKTMGRGRVIGVDIEIRPHNRKAIEEHPLAEYITLIEADSAAPQTLEQVRSLIEPGQTVMVMLDSCHTKAHVLKELEAYSPLVTEGSYIVAMDGIMSKLSGAPRTEPDWTWNNPCEAVSEFVSEHPEFVEEEPAFAFNEGEITERVTYWPNAFVKRVSS
ncbi:hydroxylase [Planctomycetales bacterium ZRK34]|nr:hydroxylase [Planctomycetales bacterium ZRK34]